MLNLLILKVLPLLWHLVLPLGLLLGWIIRRSRWFPTALLIYLIWYFVGASLVMARADSPFHMFSIVVLGPASFPLFIAELLATYPQITVVPFLIAASTASSLLFIPVLRSGLASAIITWHAIFFIVGNEVTDLMVGNLMQDRARQIAHGREYQIHRRSAREMLFSEGLCCHASLWVGCELRIWSFRRMDFVRETNPRNARYFRKTCEAASGPGPQGVVAGRKAGRAQRTRRTPTELTGRP